MSDRLLKGLNEEQRRAVETTEGPLLILAGAGSGKTKTLTHRIAYLLDKQLASPPNILAVTFTNKAAKEMRERVARLLGGSADNRNFMPYMGTFHGICVRLLRQDAEAINLPRSFVIFDESDRLAAIKQICRSLLIDEKAFPPRLLANLISGAKNDLISEAEYEGLAQSPAQQVAAKVYPLYTRSLREASALDFDDLINKTVELLKTNGEVKAKWQKQFKYVLIDEYQDTNSAQYQLVNLLINEKKNIAVVGDDWQSIYSFRNADYRNILRFETDFKGCTVIKLEQNYRSTKNILEAAQSVITKNQERTDKQLWTEAGDGMPVQILAVGNERAEGEAIIRRIRLAVDSGKRRFSDFAVLYRTNAQSRSIEETLVHYQIPYKIVGGVRFYDRKEIKDILAYLRLIFQPEDRVSFERVVNVPSRGIGAKSLATFLSWQSSSSLSLKDALVNAHDCPDLTPKARTALSGLGDIILSLQRVSESASVSGLIDSLLRRIDYLHYLDDGTPQGEARVENVKELLSVAMEYNEVGLDGFLEEVALISDIDSANLSDNSVTLMTLHSAKGLEFPVIFMPGLEEAILPHSRALYEQSEMEEERRLCYVGMTRAREELYLIYAASRLLYGGVQHNPPSRFLSEIDGETQEVGSNPFNQPLLSRDTEVAMGDTIDEPHFIPDLNEGDTVRHQVFGQGTVLEINDDMATIFFKGKGAKKLSLSFAPLEKL